MTLNPRLDPYLRWRLANDRGFEAALFPGRDSSKADPAYPEAVDQRLFAVVVQLRAAGQPLIISPPAKQIKGRSWLPGLNDFYAPMHTHAVDANARRTRYQPGLVNAYGLRLLMDALDHLDDSGVNLIRWELAQTGDPVEFETGAFVQPGSGAGNSRGQSKPASWPFTEVAKKLALRAQIIPLHPVASRATLTRGTRLAPVSVSVIDDGCPFASPWLGTAGQSVVPEMLVQATEAERFEELDATRNYSSALRVPPLGLPSEPADFRGSLLGRRLDPQRVSSPTNRLRVDPSNEPAMYRASDYLYPATHGKHGAAVLDLIANTRLWIGRKARERCAPCDVHFVQLPVSSIVDTSGISLSAHVLTALHEALDRAPSGHDVLVNLSFGNHSGPHDGTSMIESAFVELLDLYDGGPEASGKRLILVLPAGNSHLLRCHAQGHACHERPGVVDWKVLPDDDTDNFIEIWVPRSRAVHVRVIAPDGEDVCLSVDPVSRPYIEAYVQDGSNKGQHSALLQYVKEPPQSAHASLLLLAVGGNRKLTSDQEIKSWPPKTYLKEVSEVADGSSRKFGQEGVGTRPASRPRHGIWRIEITPLNAHDTQPIPWHAYVQRGDVAPLRRRSARGVFGRQSYIIDNCESKADPTFTLNGIATASHPRLFVVGAMERADGRLSPYSASGPRVPPGLDPGQVGDGDDGRVEGPDWVVAADESRRRHGLLVNGVLGGSRLRMSGTSMAAATFTRHLWEHLSAGKSLETFCWLPPSDEPAPTVIPVDAPCHASDVCRGKHRRIVSTRPDGSL